MGEPGHFQRVFTHVPHRENVGVLGELNYVRLGGQNSGKHVSPDAKSSLFLSDVAAYYRLGSGFLGQEGGCLVGFDLLAGASGFGASPAFAWDAMALLGYSFWDQGTLLLGYRAVGVNHDGQW